LTHNRKRIMNRSKINGEPLVSICSAAYNQELFIRQCLDGFLMQATDFPFEIVVHDDASADNTADIIREYAEAYPDIIKPIFQAENQYSKGTKVLATYVWPQAQGKYIALCDGDDYWTDPLKLQKQVDFLEANGDYVICAGRSLERDGDELHDCWASKTGTITFRDIAHSNTIQTNTVIFRNIFKQDNFPKMHKYLRESVNGDIFLYLSLLVEGKGYILPDNVGVYRRHAGGIMGKKPDGERYLRSLKTRNTIIDYLKDIKADESYVEDVEYGYLLLLEGYLSKNPLTEDFIVTVPRHILNRAISRLTGNRQEQISAANRSNEKTAISSEADSSRDIAPGFSETPGEDYETFSTRVARNHFKQCDLFVDVGARYGYYSLLAARVNKDIRILSVEPNPETFSVLRDNIESLANPHARAVNAELTSHEEASRLHHSAASNDATLPAHVNVGPMGQSRVDCLTVDELLKDDGSKSVFLKIDAQGKELNVLKGMERTLDAYAGISMLIEMNPEMLKLAGTDCAGVHHYLSSKGFGVYALDEAEATFSPLVVPENLLRFESSFEHFRALCVRTTGSLSVAFFSHSSGLAGAERSLLDLVTDLCLRSVLCTVFMPSEGPLKQEMINAGAAVHVVPYTWWCNTADDVAQEIPYDVFDSLNSVIHSVLPRLRALNPDVVFSQTMVTPWGALCAELLGTPHAWSVCEFGRLDHGLHFYYGFKKSVDLLYRRSSVIYSITKAVRDEVFKHIKDREKKIEVVYRAVRINDQFLRINEDVEVLPNVTPSIGAFGIIQQGKGQEDLVRAGIALLDGGYDINLFFYGACDPTYAEYLKSLIADSKHKDRFRFMGFVNDALTCMSSVDIVVSCARHEAFGRTIIEAMLLKKPVVYAMSGGPTEFLKNGRHGMAYTPGDVRELTEKIKTLLTDRSIVKKMVSCAFEHIQTTFSVENHSGRIEKSLRKAKETKPTVGREILDFVTRGFPYDVLKNASVVPKLYFAPENGGFSEECTITHHRILNGLFNIRFDLPGANCRHLRLDFIGNGFIRLRILRITVRRGPKGSIMLYPLSGLRSNRHAVEDKWMHFLAIQPQLLMELKEDFASLTVCGEWHRNTAMDVSRHINTALTERNSQMVEAYAQIASLGQAIGERDGRIASLGQTIGERDQQLLNLERTLTDRDAKVEEYSKQLSDRSQEVAEANERLGRVALELSKNTQMLAEYREELTASERRSADVASRLSATERQAVVYEQQIDYMTHSRSWRITAWLRYLYSCFAAKKRNGD